MFLLQRASKVPHKGVVQKPKGKFENLGAKKLGYDFKPESFFPISWGGELTVKNCLLANNKGNVLRREKNS